MDMIKYYSSGFVLYALSSLMANPYLLIKRRLQLGINGGVLQTLSSEGPKSLFRGGSLCWVSGSNRMVYFTLYEHVTTVLDHVRDGSTTRQHTDSVSYSTASNGKQSLSKGVAGAVVCYQIYYALQKFVHVS